MTHLTVTFTLPISYSGTVSVINGATNTVIATIPVGTWPVGVAYDPSNGYIYVTNFDSGTVSVINGQPTLLSQISPLEHGQRGLHMTHPTGTFTLPITFRAPLV